MSWPLIGGHFEFFMQLNYVFNILSQNLKMASRSRNMWLCSRKCSCNAVVLDYIIPLRYYMLEQLK